MSVLGGIDIALWDAAGMILNKPVSKLLGGNFGEEFPLYSHGSGTAEFLHGVRRQHAAGRTKPRTAKSV